VKRHLITVKYMDAANANSIYAKRKKKIEQRCTEKGEVPRSLTGRMGRGAPCGPV